MYGVAWCLISVLTATAEPEAVVLEFTRPSACVPCQQIAPTVTRLQREGFPIRVIDVDVQPSAASPYRIQAVPTFILLIAGREADRIEGKPPESELRRLCDRARLANVSAVEAAVPEANTTFPPLPKGGPGGVNPADSTPTKSASNAKTDAKPAARATPTTPPSEGGEIRTGPIIRAKNDDSANLPPISSADPLHVCPRIRVKDSLGVNFGTGTIIDSREGRTTILTCGHIFRKLDEKSIIEVDVFLGAKHETFVGRVLKYDLEADVGLLWIPTSRPLPAAPIAEPTAPPAAGQHVFSVGCSGGDPPTKLQHRVTALNRYLGPDNIECTGVPIQGRSGGGLFDTDGRLIGVCIAADQRDQRGLYAALSPVFELLDQAKLTHLIPPTAARPQRTLPVDEPPFEIEVASSAVAESPFAASALSAESVLAANEPAVIAAAASSEPPLRSSAELKSALPSAEEAEVVCIIRPLNNPRAASRVVIINRASGKFLSQLAGEMDQQAKPTSAVIRQANSVAKPNIDATTPKPYRRASHSRLAP